MMITISTSQGWGADSSKSCIENALLSVLLETLPGTYHHPPPQAAWLLSNTSALPALTPFRLRSSCYLCPSCPGHPQWRLSQTYFSGQSFMLRSFLASFSLSKPTSPIIFPSLMAYDLAKDDGIFKCDNHERAVKEKRGWESETDRVTERLPAGTAFCCRVNRALKLWLK